MRKHLLASVAIAALGSSAFAADLPARGPAMAPAPIVSAPIFTWTGFYVGVNAGASFNKNQNFSSNGFNTPNGAVTIYSGTNDDAHFTGGGQIGFNWQTGSFVWGLEADINYLNRSGNGAVVAPAGAALPFALINSGDRDTWFGTARGRLGLGFDRALFYVTGGLAFGGNRNDATVTFFNNGGVGNLPCAAGCAFGATGSGNSDIGWALGGGIEYAFSNSVSAKIEYLHVELGDNRRTYTPVGFPNSTATITTRRSNQFDIVRAGLNFRFGAFSQAAPVVARY